MTATERVEAVNSARHTLIQAATGLVVIGGVVFTAQGLRYTAETLNTTQQGQITDRYTKAVEQLGSSKSDVRLGGIYALQRLAVDSPRDRDTIRNVLSAFVRNHDGCTLQPGEKTLPKRCGDAPGGTDRPVVRLPADVVAALTIAPTLPAFNRNDTGRADFSYSRFPGADLTRMDLTNAILTNANLKGVSLESAILSGANLTFADLTDADVDYTPLTGAYMYRANLTGASLDNANLDGANLTAADLTRANLANANLTGAYLITADLTRANLSGADLSWANLSGADLRGIRGMTEQEVREMATVDPYTKFGPLE
jgi:uncharacterized protein YjbI with pentapeptide repeats